MAKARDVAALRLLVSMALRRGEVASLDVRHYDAAAGTLSVLRKGKSSRVTLTVPESARKALAAWIRLHPAADDPKAPLLVSVDNRSFGARLSGSGLYRIVQAAGRRVGLRCRPHLLRHSAVTAALDATNGDVRSVAKFSGHSSIAMVVRYDDLRADTFGELAQLVDGIVSERVAARRAGA